MYNRYRAGSNGMSMYETILRYLKERKRGILATVVARAGAAPRDVGAKMLVGEDGMFGTIGGGTLEAWVIEEAVKSMDDGEARLLHFRMNAQAVADEGMLCGGDVDVLLEPLLARYEDVYQAAQECEKKGLRSLLVTRFSKNPPRKSLLDHQGKVWGDELSPDDISTLRAYWHESHVRLLPDQTVIEPVTGYATLYIFGAGHVSQFLSKVAKMVDFKVTIIDDRAEFANRERFPEADTVLVEDFAQAFERLDFSCEPYVVIVTRGHSHDALVLEKSISRPVRYIGMIGSKRKVRIVLEHLEKKGVKKELIESVHAPIGIDINSETPQEIAISIVAELIRERGRKR